MPAATNKADLIAVAEKEYGKLKTLIDPLDDEAAAKNMDGVSIRHVIGHRAHWIDLFLGWHADGQTGKPVAFPAPGYKWSELNRYNADLREKQADLSWGDVRAMLADRHACLMAFLEAHDDAHLYGGPMKGANNAWTTGRWAEAAGPSHYRSAAKFIRQVLRG